jgi:hypothetical protein
VRDGAYSGETRVRDARARTWIRRGYRYGDLFNRRKVEVEETHAHRGGDGRGGGEITITIRIRIMEGRDDIVVLSFFLFFFCLGAS